ncbi:MAG: LPXTG cell wall anchor domain-containing protein, partial [Verrucomicrobiota bacterium]
LLPEDLKVEYNKEIDDAREWDSTGEEQEGLLLTKEENPLKEPSTRPSQTGNRKTYVTLAGLAFILGLAVFVGAKRRR